MRALLPGLLALAALCANPGLARAGCGDNPGDAEAVTAARAAIDATCTCSTESPPAVNHGQYVKCAVGVVNQRAGDDQLPTYCKGAVKRCAARSTCGKPGFVTCCRTSESGKTKCSTKSDADRCVAPAGGSACAGAFTSCCDACTDGGCAAPPAP
jgi:hypothetical protein